MKKILVIALMLATASPLGGAGIALANSSTDPLCGPDAPAGYKRPGGYCDQIDSKGSLIDMKEDCDVRLKSMLTRLDERILVAVDCREYEDLYPEL